MAGDNTLLIRKVGNNETKKDTEKDFGIVVLELPMLVSNEVKDSGSTNWMDEHGIDAYNAPQAYFKDFDTDIKLGVKASTPAECHSAYTSFLSYLTTNGILHDLYCPWTQIGRTKVRYKSTSDINFNRQNGESIMTFKIKFNITDPTTLIAEF